MPNIHLTTFIAAPPERVFDLSRCIDLHKRSMSKFGETPVAGITTGLIEQGQDVTWKAKHLFKWRILKVRITSMKKPLEFTDEQVDGDFKSMKHQHVFKPCDNGTIMIDLFEFETPYGMAGTWLSKLYLTNYMKNLLEERNKAIKQAAESVQWKNYLIK